MLLPFSIMVVECYLFGKGLFMRLAVRNYVRSIVGVGQILYVSFFPLY